MVGRLAHRLAVSSCAGAALFGLTTAGGRIARRRGPPETLAGDRAEDSGTPASQILALACGTGALVGAGYALARPALPRRAVVAGLVYALGEGVTTRAQLNALFELLGRDERFGVSASRLAGEVVLGLWLAGAERLFGPRR